MRDETIVTRTVVLPAMPHRIVSSFAGRLSDLIETHAESSLYMVTGFLGWSDDTTPRTDRPVRFHPKGRPSPYTGPTDVCVESAYNSTFRLSQPVRVF